VTHLRCCGIIIAHFPTKFASDKTVTRNSADKPRDAFRGQSRSPFHMIDMVSY